MKRTMDEILQNLHGIGTDDDVQLWIIVNRVTSYLNIDEHKMTLAEAETFWTTMSEVITKMLQTGFIAVDLTGSDSYGYKAWPEQDPKQVMSIIRNRWIELKGKFPDVGFIVWFHKIDKQPSA